MPNVGLAKESKNPRCGGGGSSAGKGYRLMGAAGWQNAPPIKKLCLCVFSRVRLCSAGIFKEKLMLEWVRFEPL